ncbi:oxidoreductase [Lentinus tigrinus ALCF2SS1-7]|uniref:Oxidoreductase n=1 Tax=Lentinus tigrinus ALCF2SS1-6 TaxID=1328759 RepID=A0A5C2RVS7_9APHY|nr:oxidoreductase [Lentinus tigrinus ALCF2SS1-6]RPD69260.1 oxidoreductase [Lentinus tigrinus ALCF2SS1-7]
MPSIWTSLASLALIPALFLVATRILSFKTRWDPCLKHCFVTGGSSGAGLALATLLAQNGAHVSIVARDKAKLQKALEVLETVRHNPQQIFRAYSFAVNTEQGSVAAIGAASEPFDGHCPDAYFLCAGASRPGFFVEQTEESLKAGMESTYYAQAFSALAATKAMVQQGVKGKVVFCSSILGYFSMVGYSTYSPGKFALRGLAETLQSEFMLYGIDVHIAFPGTIYSPGYEEENRCKPKITLKIEETDDGAQPEVVAKVILDGVRSGKFHISVDFIGHVFRTSTAGSSERNSYLLDWVHAVVGYIGLPTWRKMWVDNLVVKHRDEHEGYLRERGLCSVE